MIPEEDNWKWLIKKLKKIKKNGGEIQSVGIEGRDDGSAAIIIEFMKR